MPDEQIGWWGKADVILKPFGGLLTALAVAFVGVYGSAALNRSQAEYTAALDRSQARDTDVRLYAQLMSQREEAETSLRKDMFNSIIGTFLRPTSVGHEEKILNLELLAYNFHEALNLAPLFKAVYREIDRSKAPNADEYLKRLEEAAEQVKGKQIATLEDAGQKLDGTVDLNVLEKHLEGIKVLEGDLSLQSEDTDELKPVLRKRHFKLEALLVNKTKRQIRVKLEVRTPQNESADSKAEPDHLDQVFWISAFDFPMIDNTRLTHGERCAVVVKFGKPVARFILVYFPGSRASLKEKPFFDEAMRDLLHTRNLLRRENQ